MRRLTALDAQFLYAEEMRPAAHAHTIKVSIIRMADLGDGSQPYDFEGVKNAIRRRVHLLPPFRWKLMRTPGDLHNPIWVDDQNFDLDFHIRRLGCPQPGGRRELCEVIADISGRPLDRSRPLWEMYVVEGMADGTIAVVVKMHHAMADGVASSQLLDLIYDKSPEAKDIADDDWSPAPAPSRLQLVVRSLAEVLRVVVYGIPSTIKLSFKAFKAKRRAGLDAADLPPKVFTAPPSPFNGILTPHRRFTTLTVSMAELREIKTAFGTTINDVVLAVGAGGIRRYLLRAGRPIEAPFVGSVPASTRQEGERPAWGNHLAVIYVNMPVDVADPVERLLAARAYANAAKADLERTLGSRLENWIEFLPVRALKVIGGLMMTAVKAGKVSQNLIISNVPGPRERLYIDGAEVETFFSMGPLSEGVGLNITAWSYVDEMHVCLLACRELVPDLWDLTDDLLAAFDELLAAARAKVPASAAAPAPASADATA